MFVPRNLLGLQAGKTLGLPHHTQHKGFSIPHEVTMCVESSGKLPPDRLPKEPPLIILDEPDQTFKQILDGKTCGDSHAFTLNRFRALLQYAREQKGWIVLSLDGLTNLELDLIREASGLEVVEFFRFDRTDTAAREYTLYDHPSATWSETKDRLHNGENLVIVSDSDKWLRETEQMAISEGIPSEKIYIIDSQTSQEPWAKEFSLDPDAFIAKYDPRIIGYSPSVNSGVSLDDKVGHFSAMAIHLVHLEPRAGKQLPDRLRSDVPRFGYVKERGAIPDSLFSSCRPDVILRDLYRNVEGVNKLTEFAKYANENQQTDHEGNPIDIVEAMNRAKASQNDATSDYGFYLKHWSKYRAREAYGKLALRDNYIKIWQQQGHSIEFVETGNLKPLSRQRKAIRGTLDCAESIALASADTATMTVSEARDIQSNLGSSVEQRRAAKKRLLEDKLPGCDLSNPEFVLKAVIENDGKFLKAAELLWLSRNPETAKTLDRWNWLAAFSKAEKRNEIVWLPKLSFRSGQAKLLNECPLLPFIEGGVLQWTNDTPEAIAVHEWCVFHSRQLKRYLRLNVEATHDPVKTVNKLLRKLGYEIKAKLVGRSRKIPGSGYRLYSIANLEDADREAIIASLDERFLKRLQGKNEAPSPPSVITTRIDISALASCDHTAEFKVGDRVKTPKGEAEIFQISDGAFWVDGRDFQTGQRFAAKFTQVEAIA
ncbi:hypothetical protein [Microcoleus sp. FACHB-1515]|uniref:hypothetical protein n=1 Tax=Cyanophyceae TaxID=3028117 RepID=UPI001F54E750|nr:hypothetical protein [Microcoleus sp. FACHB-1515]